jgi:hypothetical protein
MDGPFAEEILEKRDWSMNWGKFVAGKGGNMNQGFGTRHGMTGIVFLHLLAFAVLAGGALFATDSHAYQRYNDGCQTCHGAFTDSTSPKGTNFGAAGNKHDMHRGASYMNTDCNLCHTTGDNRNPFLKSSDGLTGITGRGCTGCHNGPGLRTHHRTTGASSCSGCHPSPEAPPAENTNPPYYGTSATEANNACNPVATANLNENWSTGDFLGLDNDGDNLYDTSDPNCQSAIPGPMTVSPAGGLTSSGTAGGPFTPSSLSHTLTNTGTAPMNWTASKVQSWVTLSATGGTLAAGAGTTVTMSIGTGANSLAASGTSYTDTVTFTNTTNNAGNTTRPVSLTVNAAEAPTISTVSLPAGTVGTAYSLTLAATGGTTPYNWSVSSGTLPVGLSLSATGVLDGTPTTAASSSFTVRVTGADSASSTKDFSVTINAAAPPPSVDLSSGSGGGGCSVAVRTGSAGSFIDGTLILAGLGLTVWGIRIRRRRG